MTTRQEKYQAFSSFASEAESQFIALMESTPRAQTLAKMHSFYVTSGSQVGIDDRWVTVFFGKRPVNLSNGGTTILAESGAALHYSQAEDGSVACFVYPARTANRQPLDEIVMIWRYCEPEYMASYGPIANDFSAFISFAVWSGLDTKPTFLDRIRVNAALLICNTQRNGEMKRHRLNKIMHWAFYAGLSGLLLTIYAAFAK